MANRLSAAISRCHRAPPSLHVTLSVQLSENGQSRQRELTHAQKCCTSPHAEKCMREPGALIDPMRPRELIAPKFILEGFHAAAGCLSTHRNQRVIQRMLMLTCPRLQWQCVHHPSRLRGCRPGRSRASQPSLPASGSSPTQQQRGRQQKASPVLAILDTAVLAAACIRLQAHGKQC